MQATFDRCELVAPSCAAHEGPRTRVGWTGFSICQCELLRSSGVLCYFARTHLRHVFKKENKSNKHTNKQTSKRHLIEVSCSLDSARSARTPIMVPRRPNRTTVQRRQQAERADVRFLSRVLRRASLTHRGFVVGRELAKLAAQISRRKAVNAEVGVQTQLAEGGRRG